MSYIYAHLPVDENIGFNERSYVVTEGLLKYRGRDVLYLHVVATAVTFCDGRYASSLGTIGVKGYVSRWRYGTNDKGEPLSEIDPVTEAEDRRAISSMLRDKYGVPTVNFD